GNAPGPGLPVRVRGSRLDEISIRGVTLYDTVAHEQAAVLIQIQAGAPREPRELLEESTRGVEFAGVVRPPGVSDVEIALGIHGHSDRLRKRVREAHQVAARAGEILDSIRGVGEEDAAVSSDGDRVRRVELPGSRSARAPLAQVASRRREILNAVVALVDDVDIAVGSDSNIARMVELARAASRAAPARE